MIGEQEGKEVYVRKSEPHVRSRDLKNVNLATIGKYGVKSPKVNDLG